MSRTYQDIYWRNKALNSEFTRMFGWKRYQDLTEKEKAIWAKRANQIDAQYIKSQKTQQAQKTKKAAGLAESAIGYGLTRAVGSAMTAPIQAATQYAIHVMEKNYDRGFMEYRTKPYYVNYHVRPVWIKRRYTRPYRANMNAYHLPFYYSRAGPAYQHNRRTRNFWNWR